IPHNGALNPKILDDELIMKHLDDQFITNLGVSYNDHMQDYIGLFDNRKDLGKKPRPWRIDLILHIMQMAWLDIDDIVYSKFGRTCKNIEFLYLTNLLSNLIPLVLDVYTVQHQE
ncbi:24712_t:CDS:2, partial [Entrophospora sp. SA101]